MQYSGVGLLDAILEREANTVLDDDFQEMLRVSQTVFIETLAEQELSDKPIEAIYDILMGGVETVLKSKNRELFGKQFSSFKELFRDEGLTLIELLKGA